MSVTGGPVAGMIDSLDARAEQAAKLTVRDALSSVGQRSYGPFLTLPALVALSPLGGIPGLPSLLAALTAVAAAQIAFGRKHIWVPDLIGNRRIDSDKAQAAVARLRPAAGWLDRWFGTRLTALTTAPMIRMAALVCLLLALTVPPLEVIPFAATIPLGAIALIGLAITLHDGALMLAALAASGTAVILAAAMLA